MRAHVIINHRARLVRESRGFVSDLQRLLAQEQIAATFGPCPSRFGTPNSDPEADLLVAVGGDGTISAVAAECLRRNLPLGLIPAGTHNHFARDLGIPTDLAEAVHCLAHGTRTRIDLGEVNGTPFINNSSLGAYPRALEHRDKLIETFRFRKWFAQLVATLRVFAHRPLVHAELDIDGRCERCTSPFVFIGNNVYEINAIAERFRASLREGQLCLFTTHRTGLAWFFRLVWLSFRGPLNQRDEVKTRTAQSIIIRMHKPDARVSIDGEVTRLTTPLVYRIREKALEIILPLGECTS